MKIESAISYVDFIMGKPGEREANLTKEISLCWVVFPDKIRTSQVLSCGKLQNNVRERVTISRTSLKILI